MNARESPWQSDGGALAAYCHFEGDVRFARLGINISVVPPGRPMCMYHWEVEQEDFLVLAGEGVAIVEGEERPLKQWDVLHCPPKTKHVIVAGPDAALVAVCVGARFNATREDWGAYTIDEAARRYDACSEHETTSPAEAYARFPEPRPTTYGGWLPGA